MGCEYVFVGGCFCEFESWQSSEKRTTDLEIGLAVFVPVWIVGVEEKSYAEGERDEDSK